MDGMIDFVVDVLFPVALVGIIAAALIVGVSEIASRNSCSNYQENTGKPTKWEFADACYIKTESGWQRWDEYKARATTNEPTP